MKNFKYYSRDKFVFGRGKWYDGVNTGIFTFILLLQAKNHHTVHK